MEPGTQGRIIFERQYRTPHSEGYHLIAADTRLGHLDLHFTQTNVYATLVLDLQLNEAQVLDLIERIDESLVLSAETPREDLLVTVFHGKQTGLYSDDFLDERRQRRSASGGTGTPGSGTGSSTPGSGPSRPGRGRTVN